MKIITLVFGLAIAALCFVDASAQRSLNTGETAFDYIQYKRSASRALAEKDNVQPGELKEAIELFREMLIYLDKPEIRLLQESSQNLKSQSADVRFDMAKALARAGRKEETLRVLSELADISGVSIYADWIEQHSFFANLKEEPGFQDVLRRIRIVDRLYKKSALLTPYSPNMSEDEKIAGLSQFWSMVKQGFVYFDRLPDLDWDKTYLEYLPKVRQTRNTYEYYRVLQEMCALLRDGHTNVYFPKEVRESLGRPPLITVPVDGRVIVKGVYSPSLEREGIRPGTEILKIDGLPVKEYAARFVIPYVSSSTPQDLDLRAYSYVLFSGPKDSPVRLDLLNPDGSAFTRNVPRSGYTDIRPAARPPFEFRVIEGNIGYVALNTFGNEKVFTDFIKNIDAIAQTGSLVIDLRENDGGNSYYGAEILRYLIGSSFQTGSWKAREFRPLKKAAGIDLEWYGEAGESVSPIASKNYMGRIILLIGSRTFSAAEDFVMMFDAAERGRMIGEPTGGSTGQPMGFGLPGGGSARVCVKRDFYPDGRSFVGKGIFPDLDVRPSVADIAGSKDPVLETAVRELRKQ